MSRRLVALVFVLIVVILSGCGSSNTTSPSATSKVETQKPIQIAAEVISAEYRNNEVASDKKYKDKTIEVYGITTEIRKGIGDDAVVVLPGSGGGVWCYFSLKKDASVLEKLQTGKILHIQGVVGGLTLGNVVLNKSVIVTPSTTSNTTPQAGVKADGFYIEQLYKNYASNWADAVNNNDFNAVANYLLTDSELYNSQKKLYSDLYKDGIKLELITSKVKETRMTGPREYKVDVYEEYRITYKNGETEIGKYNWIYTVDSTNGWKLSKLERGKDPIHEAKETTPARGQSSNISQAIIGHWVSGNTFKVARGNLDIKNGVTTSEQPTAPMHFYFDGKIATLVKSGQIIQISYRLNEEGEGKVIELNLNNGIHLVGLNDDGKSFTLAQDLSVGNRAEMMSTVFTYVDGRTRP